MGALRGARRRENGILFGPSAYSVGPSGSLNNQRGGDHEEPSHRAPHGAPDQAPAIFLHEVRLYDAVGPKVRNYNPVNMIVNYHEIDLAN